MVKFNITLNNEECAKDEIERLKQQIEERDNLIFNAKQKNDKIRYIE